MFVHSAAGATVAGVKCESLYGLVHAFACRWAGRSLADDVTQEVFLRLLMYREEPLSSVPRAFAIKVTYNVAMTLRSALARRTKVTRASAVIRRTPSRLDRSAESTRQWLESELNGLSSRQLEAVVLTELHGLSEDQAALAMQASRSTVGTRRRTAIAHLREAASRRESGGIVAA